MINPRQEAIKLAYDKLYKKQMGDKNFEVAWTPSCKYNNSSREVQTFKFLYMKAPTLRALSGSHVGQKNFARPIVIRWLRMKGNLPISEY